jgi:hypothetical protein
MLIFTQSVIATDEVLPTLEDLYNSYPIINASDAEYRAMSLYEFAYNQGESLDFSKMPVFEQSFKSFNVTDEDLEFIAPSYVYVNITLQEQVLGVAVHPAYYFLIIESENIVIYDLDSNGRLNEWDGVFFHEDNISRWLLFDDINYTADTELKEFANWYYSTVILGTAEGFGIEPDTELTAGLMDILKIGPNLLRRATFPEQRYIDMWTDYLPQLGQYGIPTETVKSTYKITLLDQTKSNPYYHTASDTIFLTYECFNKYTYYGLNTYELKSSLTCKYLAQAYHEFVHAYWDRIAYKAKNKNDKGHVMYEVIHGIGDELTGKTVAYDLGRKKTTLSKTDAYRYAEEAVAFTAQELAEFHCRYINNRTCFAKNGTLTKKGQILFERGVYQEVINAYIVKNGDNTELYDTFPTDYAINRALEALGSKHRVNIKGKEANTKVYTKTK